jgi:hypothetical protein
MPRFIVIALVIVGSIAAGLSGAVSPVPVDPKLNQQIQDSIRAAIQDGDSARALREYRRWLELFPNEPTVRAPMYLAMSDLAEKSGDAAAAKELRATALALDPALLKKVEGNQGAPAMRGDGADKWLAVMGVAAQTMQAVQQGRTQYQAQQQQRYQQQQMQQQMFPQAPVGTQGYVAPPAGTQAMGGFAPAPASQIVGYDPQGQPIYGAAPQQFDPNQQQPAMAPQQPMMAPQQPMMAPQQPMMAPQQPMMAPQQPMMAPQQPVMTQQQPMINQQTGQPQQYQQPYQAGSYAAPRNPYPVAAGYAVRRRRGDSSAPVRVFYDRSRFGDPAYFENACGALLSAGDGVLTITSGCGEAPLVIPAAEISDVRMNVAIGKEIGAFHIATTKGLYLALATESGSRDDARKLIETLKKDLQLQ